MKIVMFEMDPWEESAWDALRREHETVQERKTLSAETAAQYQDAEAVSVFLYSRVTAEVLALLPRLRLIASRSITTDHIDLPACRQRGITVCHVPAYGENAVAEHVFALLLGISHRLVEAADRTRRGDFSLRGLQGFDLAGKTLGVVGTGAIGARVARIGRGFGMELLAHDPEPDAQLQKELGLKYVPFTELLEQADVVSLHVPARRNTEHLLSKSEFKRLKTGAVVINTSRGKVVDNQALLRALSEGQVAAAGLDVLPEEPLLHEEAELLHSSFPPQYDLEILLVDHVLLRLRNVIITPHSAFYTRETVRKISEDTVEVLRAFARGKPLHEVTG